MPAVHSALSRYRCVAVAMPAATGMTRLFGSAVLVWRVCSVCCCCVLYAGAARLAREPRRALFLLHSPRPATLSTAKLAVLRSSCCHAPRRPVARLTAVYRTPYIRPWLSAASPVCTSHTRGLLPSRNRAEPLCSVCVCVMELERARSIHLLQLSSCHCTIATLTEPTAASRE